jgi:hypothetical protein
MTTAIAPAEYQPRTASATGRLEFSQHEYDELVEEPMDYTPIPAGQLVAPDLEGEIWVEDSSGPMGF